MKMNHCSVKQQSAYAAACEEMRRENVSIYGERRESVICPKPRRLGFCDPVRPLRWQLSHQADICESKAGTDLLDIILPKGGFGAEQSYGHQVASSPPFFSGSPPSRVSNPLIQDTRFGDEKIAPLFAPSLREFLRPLQTRVSGQILEPTRRLGLRDSIAWVGITDVFLPWLRVIIIR